MTEQQTSAPSHERIDAAERATGRSKYAADWKKPDMLFGCMIRSTVPHGLVKSVDTSRALSLEGVKAIVTCMDTEIVWNAGERERQRHAFSKHVRFVGDCVGAVAATSRNIAREAVELVNFEYEELPAVFDIQESLKNNALKIWNEGNVIGPITYGFGKTEEAFSRSSLMIERDYKTSRVHGVPLEPAASLAWWDGEKLNVVAATQSIFGCRDGLAKDLGLKPENVRVITKFKGGGFGNKNNSMNYDLAAATLSKKTGQPVLIEYSREEDLTGVHGRWSSNQHLRVAVDRSSQRLLAAELKAYCDIGGYTRHIKQGKFIEGPDTYYAFDAWKSEIYGVYTNTPATGHMRAPTGPQSCFAFETMVDEVAHELHADPLKFRLNNLVQLVHAEKKLTSNGQKECLEFGAEAFGWKEKWRPPEEKSIRSGTKARGVGLAIGTWHAFVGKGEAIISLKDNGKVELFTGVVDIGTGAKSTMAMIASESLGVPVESIQVIWGDTSLCPYSIGESGGRTTSFTGTAVRQAALAVRSRIRTLASKHFKVDESVVRIADGKVFIASLSEPRVEIGELLRLARLEEMTEKATSDVVLPEDQERLAFATHFAEVEVDTETGQTSVLRYVAAHDSGRLVNRLTSESQVKGGVVMGIGMALSEKVLIDPNYGMMQNPSLMTYRLPNVMSIPEIETVFVETDDPYGPKSLGEIPIVPVPAAIGNAIFNATGVRLREIPFSPEKVLNAIDELRGVVQ